VEHQALNAVGEAEREPGGTLTECLSGSKRI